MRQPYVSPGDTVRLRDSALGTFGNLTRDQMDILRGTFLVVAVDPPMEIAENTIVYDLWLEPDWINCYVGIDDTAVEKVEPCQKTNPI